MIGEIVLVNRPEIAFLLKDFPIGGGVEKVTLNLASELAALGKAVDIVVLDAGGALDGIDWGAVRPIDLRIRFPRGPMPFKLASACLAFNNYLKRERPAVVVSAKEQANLVNALCAPHYSVRTVLTRHVPLSREAAGSDSSYGLHSIYKYLLGGRSDVLVGVSDGIAEEICRAIKPVHRTKVMSIPNPVIDSRFFDRAAQDLDWWPSGRVIVGVGRLTRQKGFDLLISALASLPEDYKLVLVGEGPDRPDLEALAAELGVGDRCHLIGFCDNPLPYIAKADVFAMPSRWEGLPTVLIEALALDRPIVATDCKYGPRQILCDGRLGKLVDTETIMPLADAILDSHQAPNQLDSILYRTEVEKYRVGSAAREYERITL